MPIDSDARKYVALSIFLRAENCQYSKYTLETKSISESIICVRKTIDPEVWR
jgi:hypothetical protein